MANREIVEGTAKGVAAQAALLPIWSTKNETAQRVRRRIGVIMRWAIAQGYRSDNPAGDAVTAALPKRPRQIRHMPALPYGEVGAALASVRVSQGLAARGQRASL